jgi:SpoIID/LytB domain protein
MNDRVRPRIHWVGALTAALIALAMLSLPASADIGPQPTPAQGRTGAGTAHASASTETELSAVLATVDGQRERRRGHVAKPFQLLGAAWDAGAQLTDQTVVQVRAYGAGGWSDWVRLTESDTKPDPDNREGKRWRRSTEPIWFGDSTDAELHITGPLPSGLRLITVNGDRHGDVPVKTGGIPAAGPGRSLAVPELVTGQPSWRTRSDWSADDSLKPTGCSSPVYNDAVKVIFVHHTANSNTYTQGDVPLLLRSIYSYQLNSGWCDIAYNAVIDRFGTIWEARSGGLDQAVRSGATGGFNTNSWAVSLLGTYSATTVPTAAYEALRRLLSWRLVIAGVDPLGTNTLTQSAGGTSVGAKWTDGTAVEFKTISGHRDAVHTDCPGDQMYGLMGRLRQDLDTTIGRQPFGALDAVIGGPGALSVAGWAIDPGSVASIGVTVDIDGTMVSLIANGERPDLASGYPPFGASHGFSASIPAGPGSHMVCLDAVNVAGGTGATRLGCRTVTVTALATEGTAVSVTEIYPRPASGAWDARGHGWGHGRGLSQWGAYGAALQGNDHAAILATYYPGTAMTSMGNPTIRVRLSADPAQLRVTPTPGLVVIQADGTTTALPSGYAGWRIVAVTGGLQLQGLSDAWTIYPLDGRTVLPAPVRFDGAGSTLRVWQADGSSTEYRGTLAAYLTSTSVTTVLSLPLESYLTGVIPQEMPASWAPAALQAQSVAARTYAAQRLTAPDSSTFDICDTTACQVFGGIRRFSPNGDATAVEQTATNAAIAASAGKILTYAGSPAFTEFSSSNGGWSVTGSRPYLLARSDPWSGTAPGDSVHAWKGRLPVAALEARWPAIGSLNQLVVLSRTGNGEWGGRIVSARLDGTAGSVTVSGDSLANARSWPSTSDGLRSSWFTLGAANQPPYGALDAVTSTRTNSITLAGWAIDPDTTNPIDVHIYLDTTLYALTANQQRPDVGAAYPTSGPNHGFATELPATPGTHTVCVYAINTPTGLNPGLGCRTVTVAANQPPYGALDAVTSTRTNSITLAGWAIDPDTTNPIDVHIYLDTTLYALTANQQRPDVGAAYPTSGPNHGFATELPATPGTHTVCVYAINTPTGLNPGLGCRTVTVAANQPPYGALDAVTSTRTNSITLAGWAIDPDTTNPIDVHIYLDTTLYALTANQQRPDVGAAYPTSGPNHGFATELPATPGTHTVCVYAINTPTGLNPGLGCRTVTVAANQPPYGALVRCSSVFVRLGAGDQTTSGSSGLG